jgi:hypothetical protein
MQRKIQAIESSPHPTDHSKTFKKINMHGFSGPTGPFLLSVSHQPQSMLRFELIRAQLLRCLGQWFALPRLNQAKRASCIHTHLLHFRTLQQIPSKRSGSRAFKP